MPPLNLLLLTSLPLFPLLAGIAARGQSASTAAKVTHAAALLALLAAAAGTVLLATGAPLAGAWLRCDALAAVMSLLVSFLGTVVLRFSRNYLAGDPEQAKFFSWMSLTLGAVLTLVLANHLILFLAAWIVMSLFLHRLLLHRPERRGAVFSARKKFFFSRLGDLALLSATLLLVSHHGTWRIDELIHSVAHGHTGGLPGAGYLLAIAAILKSAQFPFHSWLPDTMETPTPVSALMHAGLVNAGGFLILRFSPLFLYAPGALHLLVIFGAVTAAFGAIVMLAQPGVKRSLAYSTIAQMGFMILQCGLGAWPLALLHLVAHSLYKAHAFLTTGSTIGAVPRRAIPLGTAALLAGLLLGALLVIGLVILAQFIHPHAGSPVFSTILALALAYGLARAFSAKGGPRLVAKAVALALGIAAAGVALHTGAAMIFDGIPAPPTPTGLSAFVVCVFVALFLFQALLWRANGTPLGQRFYVHALNGFYVGTAANKFLNRLWPHRSAA